MELHARILIMDKITIILNEGCNKTIIKYLTENLILTYHELDLIHITIITYYLIESIKDGSDSTVGFQLHREI